MEFHQVLYVCLTGFQYRGVSPAVIYDGDISFEPEPSNQYDSNAIKVLVNDKFVGYVVKAHNINFRKYITSLWKPRIRLTTPGGDAVLIYDDIKFR